MSTVSRHRPANGPCVIRPIRSRRPTVRKPCAAKSRSEAAFSGKIDA